MTKKICFLTAFFIAFIFTVSAQVKQTPATKIITGQYGFESETDINGWFAKNSRINLSAVHYKDGQRSLEWSWKKGSMLQIAALKGLKEASEIYVGGQPEIYEPSFYPQERFGGIKMWLYQEKPVRGQMVFQVGSDMTSAQNNPKYRFAVNLQFKGWRTIWVAFEEDAKVVGYKGSDELRTLVAYPNNINENSGTLFIDHFTLLSFVSNKRSSDVQFVNNKRRDLRASDAYDILGPWNAFNNNNNNNNNIDTLTLAAESKQIADRLQFLILGNSANDWKQRNPNLEKDLAERIKTAMSFYDRLKIRKENGFITGTPLFAIRDEHPAAEGLVFDDAMLPVMFPLGMDYKCNNNILAKERLMQMFDYFLDQGWAAGSGLGSVDHIIKMAPIAIPLFLLRDELKAQNKLKEQADMLAWHTRLGSLKNIDYTRGENSDLVRGGAVAKLVAILLMENSARKQRLLRDFKSYMDHVAAISPGYSDTFKSDFSIYHHRGTYLNTYGTNALNTMALIHWLLQGTPYALSPQSTSNLKQALVRQAAIAFGIEIHYGVGGRFPLNNNSIEKFILPAYAYMSMSGDVVSDTTMGALFNYLYHISDPQMINPMLWPALTYSGTFGTVDLMVRLHNQMNGLERKPIDGVTIMPFSSLMTYRKENAFATVKGYNKYVWDFEAGKGQNNMGRYLSHGMLVVGQGKEKDGFVGMDMNDGFDWSMLPGATTKMLPADKLLYFISPDKKYVEGKHRNFSESLVASGLQQGNNGLFGFDLRDDVFPDEDKSLFDNSFRAKKTYFFIGNEIICLGSDVSNNDMRYNTVTTLFQYHFDQQHPNYFNNKILHEGQKKIDGGWFTDQNGLQYIVPQGQSVIYSQKNQPSYRAENVGDQQKIKRGTDGPYQKTDAVYTKVYFDHGVAPQSRGYEYEIILNTTANAVKPYLDNKTYTVLQKNSKAHIIHHKATGITAYSVFEPNTSLKGILLNTDVPLLVMAKEGKGTSLLLSVANPDLKQAKWNHNMSNMPDSVNNAWNKGSIVTLTIRGEWFPAKHIDQLVSCEIKNKNTVVCFFCRDGQSLDLPLQNRVPESE